MVALQSPLLLHLQAVLADSLVSDPQSDVDLDE